MLNLTKQEFFDKVCTHLKTQRDVSVGPHGLCAYRGEDGKMCAIGPFLTDKQAHEYEGQSVRAIPLDVIEAPLQTLALACQEAHDSQEGVAEPKFKAKLKAVAKAFKLKWHHG